MTCLALHPTTSQLTAGGLLCVRGQAGQVKRRRMALRPAGVSAISKLFTAQVWVNSFETSLMANRGPGGGGI